MTEPIRAAVKTVSIARIAELLSRFPRFRTRFFREAERVYCDSMRRKPAQQYAARLAAKLACRHVLGAGALADIEITRDGMGAPHLVLHDAAARQAKGLCMRVSLSHDGDMAAAIVSGEQL